MAHFQVQSGKALFDSESQLQRWPFNASGFRLFVNGDAGNERIGLAPGAAVTLQLAGIDPRSPLTIRSSDPGVAEITPAGSIRSGALDFTLKAKGAGKAKLEGVDASSAAVAGPLEVVVGPVAKHPDLAVDLIADVLAGNDALKIHGLQRMLNDNFDNVFEQQNKSNYHNRFKNKACGIVAKFRGNQCPTQNSTRDSSTLRGGGSGA